MLDRLKPSIQKQSEAFDKAFRADIIGVIHDQFAGHKIAEIHLGWNVDFDGDDSLVVDVIIADDISSYSGSSLSGLTRRLREVLKTHSLSAFPLVSFLSVSELNEVAA